MTQPQNSPYSPKPRRTGAWVRFCGLVMYVANFEHLGYRYELIGPLPPQAAKDAEGCSL